MKTPPPRQVPCQSPEGLIANLEDGDRQVGRGSGEVGAPELAGKGGEESGAVSPEMRARASRIPVTTPVLRNAE